MRNIIKFMLASAIIIAVFMVFYQKSAITDMDAMTGNVIFEKTDRPPELYFCPQDDCMAVLIDNVNRSSKIECAIYDMKNDALLKLLEEKRARIYIDKNYAKNLKEYNIYSKTNKYYLMHNKFCIFDDERIFTGSFNAIRNNDRNNLLIIHSKQLAKNYADEFSELWEGKYPVKTENPKVSVNGILFESYFCPEDWCASKIMAEIEKAKSNVVFMTFSFTHDEIGDLLIEKKNEGLNISGMMERSQATTNYSEYRRLRSAGIDVVLDKGKELMHHKVFIIDNSTVITGSMNPTENGDAKNDENILIIRSSDAARRFLDEFDRIK